MAEANLRHPEPIIKPHSAALVSAARAPALELVEPDHGRAGRELNEPPGQH